MVSFWWMFGDVDALLVTYYSSSVGICSCHYECIATYYDASFNCSTLISTLQFADNFINENVWGLMLPAEHFVPSSHIRFQLSPWGNTSLSTNLQRSGPSDRLFCQPLGIEETNTTRRSFSSVTAKTLGLFTSFETSSLWIDCIDEGI